MAWVTPKTDWHGGRDANGVYTGDYFNAADFNRIKNNIQHLRDMAVKLYPSFPIVSLGEDRTYSDYLYADEITQLGANLQKINDRTLKREIGSAPTYVANGYTMDFKELNRLEKGTLEIYTRLNEQAVNRRTLVWNFGIKEGF
jgi:hypothetical protein